LAYAQYFLVGFLLTEFYLSATARDGKSRLWDLTSIAGWCLLLALLVVGGQAVRWVLPWLIVLLYIAAFQGVIVRRVITNPWITVIGGMCYSIYLLHNYAIAALGMVTEGIGSTSLFAVRLLIQFLVMAPAVLIISAMYFRFIERPCMRPNWPTRLRALIWGYR
jgi:peptidoglycan/LPS O-acetylase OafA/YrhL